MTVLQPASWQDVIFMEDFQEDALATSTASVRVCLFLLLTLCSAGGVVGHLWVGLIRIGPPIFSFLFFWLLDGVDSRPVRLYRWIERELLCMREAAIARCIRPVTPP